MQSIDRLFGQADQARKAQRFAEARASLDTLIILAGRCADDLARAQALTMKAQVERDSGHSVAAVPLYEEAVAVYRRTTDVLALASTLRQLGDTYQTREDYDEASSRYEEALTICKALGDDTDVAPARTDQDIRLDADKMHEALAQCRRAWADPIQAAS